MNQHLAKHTYLVGGAIRDKMLGLPVHEYDWVVVGAKGSDLLKEGFIQVGKDFPVFLHPETKEEYALARTERKTAKGYHGFEFDTGENVTLEMDLLRRDLTINAIAEDSEGHLIDPYQGQTDLKNKILRHISPAFCEDPLRVLRVARFAARFHHLGFKIAPETLALMKELSQQGELETLTPERIFMELKKALQTKAPHIFFQVLKDCNALSVIFPEIDALFGIPNPPQWHPEVDSGIHTMMVLEQCAKLTREPETRFAALCHDLGKTKTPQKYWPSHRGHEKAGVAVIEQLCERLKVPKTWKQLAIISSEYHIKIHKLNELKPATIVKLFMDLDAFRRPERFQQFLITCEADSKGRLGLESKPYPQAEIAKTILDKLTQLDLQSIIDKCRQTSDIQREIFQARVACIQQLKLLE